MCAPELKTSEKALTVDMLAGKRICSTMRSQRRATTTMRSPSCTWRVSSWGEWLALTQNLYLGSLCTVPEAFW